MLTRNESSVRESVRHEQFVCRYITKMQEIEIPEKWGREAKRDFFIFKKVEEEKTRNKKRLQGLQICLCLLVLRQLCESE